MLRWLSIFAGLLIMMGDVTQLESSAVGTQLSNGESIVMLKARTAKGVGLNLNAIESQYLSTDLQRRHQPSHLSISCLALKSSGIGLTSMMGGQGWPVESFPSTRDRTAEQKSMFVSQFVQPKTEVTRRHLSIRPIALIEREAGMFNVIASYRRPISGHIL